MLRMRPTAGFTRPSSRSKKAGAGSRCSVVLADDDGVRRAIGCAVGDSTMLVCARSFRLAFATAVSAAAVALAAAAGVLPA